MTIPELKEFFEGKTFTPPIQISEDQIVEDPVLFLKTQFIMVGQWPEKKPLASLFEVDEVLGGGEIRRYYFCALFAKFDI
ncbi:DUF6965 family protein [Sphingobacterium deserti]|uniref:DUF6965 domain-containing protein n=1 Tax=Sphingobacterium deserti TaxID=1229276 RepID=A0A0B8T5Z6_9SPHI|nr:hypothetical protein [Sphingobacterium deserti]KGE16223.1 hypothetical protein DI53_0056 [Sphingobacterium deserti]